jgi:hypothetical protein
MMNFIGEKVLPITVYRPGLASYPQVSVALQKATGDIIAGKSVDEAAGNYQTELAKAVGATGNAATCVTGGSAVEPRRNVRPAGDVAPVGSQQGHVVAV